MSVKFIEKPSLTFSQAVSHVWNNLNNFNGRSRRSELWWFMLVFCVSVKIVGMMLPLALPKAASYVVEELLWYFALAVTVRRLQDTGKSRWWVLVSWICSLVINVYVVSAFDFDVLAASPTLEAWIPVFTDPVVILFTLVGAVTGIATFIFCLLDSAVTENKYGDSPKYVIADGDAASATDDATVIG